MSDKKSSISHGKSYQEIGDYWDQHDLTDFWEKTEQAFFEVDIQSQRRYFPVDRELTEKIMKAARDRGISPEALLNLWIQEKVTQMK